MKTNKMFIFIVLCLLFMPFVLAQEGTIDLLALIKKDNEEHGIVATLDLKLIDGEEKVFIHTFPMTQLDTQVSMRLAQQISCKEYDFDCSKKDFLYTVTAVPGILGGPSAGAAAAVLTSALLQNKTINHSIAITGTINSGGLIGMVGGLEKKIEAAAREGKKKVLIPFGSSKFQISNKTADLIEIGKLYGIEVVEVSTLEEAFNIMTGTTSKKKEQIFKIDEKYQTKMKKVAEQLCNRTKQLQEELNLDEKTNYTERAEQTFQEGDFYSAASYCFRESVELRKKQYHTKTTTETNQILSDLKNTIAQKKQELQQRKIRTLTDIETYMVVMERLEDAEKILEEAKKENKKLDEYAGLATERIYSADAWSQFFDLTYDTRINIDEQDIKKSCNTKIAEAEERFNYAQIYFQKSNVQIQKTILEEAYESIEDEDYIMCLYKASKSKAESDLLIALSGTTTENLNKTIRVKLDLAKTAIIKAMNKGAFPIISYSYYEYAQNLLQENEVSAPIFTEYALELANIDLYFKQETGSHVQIIKQKEKNFDFVSKLISAGVLIFIIIMIILYFEIKSKKGKPCKPHE